MFSNAENSRKRQRGPNFTPSEKEALISIVEGFKKILENKKTDSVTNEDKEKAWQKITDIFNSQNTTFRSSETLKIFYNNLKKNLKKKAADYKKETHLTGGGSAPPDLTYSEQKLLTILNKKTIYGLNANMHDSDATDIAKKNDMNAKASEKVSAKVLSSSSSVSFYLPILICWFKVFNDAI